MWYVIVARNKGGNAREALSKLCIYKGPLNGFRYARVTSF